MQLAQRYDRLAASYDRHWLSYNFATAEAVLPHLPPSLKDKYVLDIGCGTGFFIEYVLTRHPQITDVTGLDPSQAMLGITKKRLSRIDDSRGGNQPLRWQVVQGTAEELPFGPATFDIVVSLSVLHYLTAPELFFAAAHRVLRSNGTLIVQDYTHNGCPGFASAMKIADCGLQHLYRPRELAQHANAAGFQVQWSRTFKISPLWRGVLLVAQKK